MTAIFRVRFLLPHCRFQYQSIIVICFVVLALLHKNHSHGKFMKNFSRFLRVAIVVAYDRSWQLRWGNDAVGAIQRAVAHVEAIYAW